MPDYKAVLVRTKSGESHSGKLRSKKRNIFIWRITSSAFVEMLSEEKILLHGE